MLMNTVFLLSVLSMVTFSQDFQAYVAKFNKIYADEEQRAMRQAIYLKKWQQINYVNSQNLGYQLGQNQFTDRTSEEVIESNSLQNFALSPIQQESFVYVKSQFQKIGALPTQVDWRTEGKVTSVKNRLPSCGGGGWAYATTTLYQSFLLIGGMSSPLDLSEKYILECTSNSSSSQSINNCTSGYIDYAIPFAISKGIPNQTISPSDICNISTDKFIRDTSLNGKFKGNHFNLTNQQMKELISYAPIAAVMYETTEFASYKSGIYSGCPTNSISSINNAVLIVGYDKNGNYIIKNSRGTGWGQNGYATISKDADCGLSYTPREIRGTNSPLVGFQALAGGIFLIAIMLAF